MIISAEEIKKLNASLLEEVDKIWIKDVIKQFKEQTGKDITELEAKELLGRNNQKIGDE